MAEVSVWAAEQSGRTILFIQPSGTKLPALWLEAGLIPADQTSGLNRSRRPPPALPRAAKGSPGAAFEAEQNAAESVSAIRPRAMGKRPDTSGANC